MYCVKSVCIRIYSGPHFPAFGLNKERYSVSLRIQSEWGKMQTRITPSMDTFRGVTLNAKESFNTLVWNLYPKEKYSSPLETPWAINLAICIYNCGMECTMKNLRGKQISKSVQVCWVSERLRIDQAFLMGNKNAEKEFWYKKSKRLFSKSKGVQCQPQMFQM